MLGCYWSGTWHRQVVPPPAYFFSRNETCAIGLQRENAGDASLQQHLPFSSCLQVKAP